MEMSDGNVYNGEFKNDVFHGQGVMSYKANKKGEKGLVFEGKFINGIMANFGVLKYPDGTVYEGHLE